MKSIVTRAPETSSYPPSNAALANSKAIVPIEVKSTASVPLVESAEISATENSWNSVVKDICKVVSENFE